MKLSKNSEMDVSWVLIWFNDFKLFEFKQKKMTSEEWCHSDGSEVSGNWYLFIYL